MISKEIDSFLFRHNKTFINVSDSIWDFAETRFKEFKSCALQSQVLEELGFTITYPSNSLPTAFIARFGTEHPVIGILGEYDALPGLSQRADTTQLCPREENPNGHGCGHNLLGTAGMAAAAALKDTITARHLLASVIYYGCPGEESGAGKSYMIQEHFFDDADVMLSWHPDDKAGILNQTLANVRVSYKFYGISSHAASSPHLGRSALDACELMNVGVNYLREHMLPEARIHYAYINAGGTAPNIVQAEAELFYAIRAPRDEDALSLTDRVNKIAQGAALMTETEVHIEQKCMYQSFLPNQTLDLLTMKYLKECLPISYTNEELTYAQKFHALGHCQASPHAMAASFNTSLRPTPTISTDAGNVSRLIPSTAFFVPCFANGSSLHEWTITAQGKSSIAYKGMFTAARILASVGLEIIENPVLLSNAKKDFLSP